MKRNLRINLLFVLILSVFMFTLGAVGCGTESNTDGKDDKDQTPAEKIVELRDYEITISTGETYEIEVLNAVDAIVYTSENNEIATVDASGTVTGVADGIAVITVVSGKNSLELNREVRPEFLVSLGVLVHKELGFPQGPFKPREQVGDRLRIVPHMLAGTVAAAPGVS